MSEYFPTTFACKMAKKVKLFPRKELEEYDELSPDAKERKIARRAFDLYERLESFQHLSIATELDNAMVAYEGISLDEDQKKVLEIIHGSTSDWAKGKVVEKILAQLSTTRSGKDIKDLSEIMISIIRGDTETDGKVTAASIEALVINTTKRE